MGARARGPGAGPLNRCPDARARHDADRGRLACSAASVLHACLSSSLRPGATVRSCSRRFAACTDVGVVPAASVAQVSFVTQQKVVLERECHTLRVQVLPFAARSPCTDTRVFLLISCETRRKSCAHCTPRQLNLEYASLHVSITACSHALALRPSAMWNESAPRGSVRAPVCDTPLSVVQALAEVATVHEEAERQAARSVGRWLGVRLVRRRGVRKGGALCPGVQQTTHARQVEGRPFPARG